MEPPARAATCVCCPSFPCAAAAIALILTSASLHAGRCYTRCWNRALVARQTASHHRQRRKASHKVSVQTAPQQCAQMLAREAGDSTQRRFASPPNHSRPRDRPRAVHAGAWLHPASAPRRLRLQRVFLCFLFVCEMVYCDTNQRFVCVCVCLCYFIEKPTVREGTGTHHTESSEIVKKCTQLESRSV